MNYSYMVVQRKYNKHTGKFDKKIKFLTFGWDNVRIWCLTLANPKNRDLDYIIHHHSVEKQGKYYKNQGYFPTYEELEKFGPDIEIRLFENDCFVKDSYQIVPLKKVQKTT